MVRSLTPRGIRCHGALTGQVLEAELLLGQRRSRAVVWDLSTGGACLAVPDERFQQQLERSLAQRPSPDAPLELDLWISHPGAPHERVFTAAQLVWLDRSPQADGGHCFIGLRFLQPLPCQGTFLQPLLRDSLLG